jgi:hypothetical protein
MSPTNLEERRALAGRARTLSYLGLGGHVLEATAAIVAGLVAGSIALIGFGADSVTRRPPAWSCFGWSPAGD